LAGCKFLDAAYREAKRRLADEYDAAQERGEINRHGGDRKTDDFKFENSKLEGIKPDQLHEARSAVQIFGQFPMRNPRRSRNSAGVRGGWCEAGA
jgi:hypothetical protein